MEVGVYLHAFLDIQARCR